MSVLQKLRKKLFPPHFSVIHWIGKDFISPKKKMKTVIDKTLEKEHPKAIMDFGSGTLMWSEYFAKKYNCPVYACDIYYEIRTPDGKQNIVYYTDFKKCCKDIQKFSFVWACDVFHHIPRDVYEDFISTIVNTTDTIIIKDNDSSHKFGFFMNRLHDKIVNGEDIYDVFPGKIAEYLHSQGFETSYFYMPKYWYPHFMLVAKRKKRKAF